ncbi:dynein assembly factor 4, axonemal isoform X2 [Ooceraea biroi]|uniref:dynein assembly factor 4, axonemal isoform X2 n=1 Tax=Ooceraea biroi TaxID=2015173 RepID=UPI000F08A21F|nr:dynein assembly factor 4, axonemal isoform X2 [Ooceraea biroi]
MPAIVIKDYHWRQTEKKIIIYVPLKGRPKKVDLFVMDNYVKVRDSFFKYLSKQLEDLHNQFSLKISFSPFILELFLWENVLEEDSECTLADTEAIFSLQKAQMALDWPSLEINDIDKEQKRGFRNKILEKAQSVLESRAKFRSEKRQQLQKKAVKVQIELDTDTLNKIESLRDSQRKAAMQDFEEWRSNAEKPFLQYISGEVQENRKAYRPPLKWFKDEHDLVRSREINSKEEEAVKEIEQEKSVVIEELKDESIIEEEIKKKLTEKNEDNVKEKLIIEEKFKDGLTVDENLTIESINKTSLKEDTVNEEFRGKTNTSTNNSAQKKTAIPHESFNLEQSCSEDSESDYETAYPKSLTGPLIKEMDQKSLQKFYAKMKKQRPDQNLIDRVLKNKYSKINRIFDEPEKAVPLPRKNGTINITFSERAFPTPARESSHVEEQEWLAKVAEARRKTGFVVEDLRPEEQDPQWLKDKGDDFFKAGNYLAAISAYTHGIKISDKMAALYVNRSAAHYALGNYYRCIEDCSKVLELMEPKCESNRVSRARCHARRGAALCKLSAPQHGIPELEAALQLDPSNDSIKHDLYTAKQYFNLKE